MHILRVTRDHTYINDNKRRPIKQCTYPKQARLADRSLFLDHIQRARLHRSG